MNEGMETLFDPMDVDHAPSSAITASQVEEAAWVLHSLSGAERRKTSEKDRTIERGLLVANSSSTLTKTNPAIDTSPRSCASRKDQDAVSVFVAPPFFPFLSPPHSPIRKVLRGGRRGRGVPGRAVQRRTVASTSARIVRRGARLRTRDPQRRENKVGGARSRPRPAEPPREGLRRRATRRLVRRAPSRCDPRRATRRPRDRTGRPTGSRVARQGARPIGAHGARRAGRGRRRRRGAQAEPSGAGTNRTRVSRPAFPAPPLVKRRPRRRRRWRASRRRRRGCGGRGDAGRGEVADRVRGHAQRGGGFGGAGEGCWARRRRRRAAFPGALRGRMEGASSVRQRRGRSPSPARGALHVERHTEEAEEVPATVAHDAELTPMVPPTPTPVPGAEEVDGDGFPITPMMAVAHHPLQPPQAFLVEENHPFSWLFKPHVRLATVGSAPRLRSPPLAKRPPGSAGNPARASVRRPSRRSWSASRPSSTSPSSTRKTTATARST